MQISRTFIFIYFLSKLNLKHYIFYKLLQTTTTTFTFTTITNKLLQTNNMQTFGIHLSVIVIKEMTRRNKNSFNIIDSELLLL